MSGATGVDKGPGTFNAQALYVNGVKPILAVRTQKKNHYRRRTNLHAGHEPGLRDH